MAAVNELDDPAQPRPFTQVARLQVCPLLPHRFWGLGIAVARQVDGVKPLVNQKIVELLRFAGRFARVGQLFAPEQGVEQGTLADIRPADKRNFGPPVGGQLRPLGGADFKGGLVEHGGMGRG